MAYLSSGGYSVTAWSQTAWSNYGFVPSFVNYGGGTGGVSVLWPKPWYQSAVSSPAGYPNGRMVPDVSAEAAVYPGMFYVFPGNVTGITGGTSESTPLLAGLLALLAQHSHGPLGLLNPALYDLGTNATQYAMAFAPITFGYNIPWTAKYGYDLVTGFGAIDMGAFARLYQTLSTQLNATSLSISVSAGNATGGQPYEFASGQTIVVGASITNSAGTHVIAGSFAATVETLQSPAAASVSLTYNAVLGNWTGNLVVPSTAAGPAYIVVSGNDASGHAGRAFCDIFAGYYLSFTQIYAEPYSLSVGFSLSGRIGWVTNGTSVSSSFNMRLQAYSILNNTYYAAGPLLAGSSSSGNFHIIVQGSFPAGVVLFSGVGAYGYLPLHNGAMLQGSLIVGPVEVEPGVVAPGQTVFVEGVAMPPYNDFSASAFYASNITFSVVDALGNIISQVTLPPLTMGKLLVPSGTPPGLHTVLISSQYNKYPSGSITGSFFGQIYVAPALSIPRISISPAVVYQGQNMTIYADIRGSGGVEVTQGLYSATLYPASVASNYWLYTYNEQIPLYYDGNLNVWTGIAAIPSESSAGSLAPLFGGPLKWSGPYGLLVSGVSSDGIPTTIDLSAQFSFLVRQGPVLTITSPAQGNLPYATSNTVVIAGMTTGNNVTINGVSVPLLGGRFNVTERLVTGMNAFAVIAADANGNSASSLVTILYLPQIGQMQAELTNISAEVRALNTSSNMNLAMGVRALQAQLKNLSAEAAYINSTYGTNISPQGPAHDLAESDIGSALRIVTESGLSHWRRRARDRAGRFGRGPARSSSEKCGIGPPGREGAAAEVMMSDHEFPNQLFRPPGQFSCHLPEVRKEKLPD